MIIFDTPKQQALLSRFDPRVRIVVGVGLSLVAALAGDPRVPAVLLMVGLALLAGSGLPARRLGGRFVEANLLIGTIAVLLPFSYPGTPLWSWGSLSYSREGLAMAGVIALRANATIALLSGLVSPMGPLAFAHGLGALGVPAKLVHLLYFMVRYLEVVHEEYHRLRDAMRVRGYRLSWRPRALAPLGYLVGMLFVRSLERSERVLAAMKCRGFNGRFPRQAGTPLRAADAVALVVVLVGVSCLLWGLPR